MGYEVTDIDILCGKDKKSFNHPGNRKFRDEVHRHLEVYKNAKRREKAEIADMIEASCCAEGGRFLRPDEEGIFHELDRKGIREKITHALRDAARKQLENAAGATRRQRYAQKQLVNRAAKRQNSPLKAGNKDNDDDDEEDASTHTEASMPPSPPKVPSSAASGMAGGPFPPGMAQRHPRPRMPNGMPPMSPGEAAVADRMMAARMMAAAAAGAGGMLPPGAAARFPMEMGGPPRHPRLHPRGGPGGPLGPLPPHHPHGPGGVPPSMSANPAAAASVAAAQATAAAARLQAQGAAAGEAQAQHRIAALMEQVQSLQVMSAMRDKEMATLRMALVDATAEAKVKDLEIRRLKEALALKDRALFTSSKKRNHTEDPPEDP